MTTSTPPAWAWLDLPIAYPANALPIHSRNLPESDAKREQNDSPDRDVSGSPVISCDRKHDATGCDEAAKVADAQSNAAPEHPAWVYLGNGVYARVDDADYDIVGCFRWRLSTYGYAVRHAYVNGQRTTRSMHMDLLGVGPGGSMQVDHANGDRLDNRRDNLRVCSPGQNMQNRRPLAAHGYKGVCHKRDGCWQAAFRPRGRQVHLGRFDNPVDAALAYDMAAIAEYGEFAWTNYLVAP